MPLHESCFRTLSGALFIALLAPGCSVNGVGLLAARVNPGDGAITYTTFAPGISVRTRADDRGASIGYSRRLCLAEHTATAPARGWYFFRLPDFPDQCYARDTLTLGTELRLTPVELSVALGARLTTTLAQVPESETISYQLRYDLSDPDSAFLRLGTSGESP